MVGGVGAVHGWIRGETASPLFADRMVHSVGSLQEAQNHWHEHEHTHAHILSPSHTHACTLTQTLVFACTRMDTHTKTITFLSFYECFINHVNGSRSYTPSHNHSHTHKNTPLLFHTLTHLPTGQNRWHSHGGILGLLQPLQPVAPC